MAYLGDQTSRKHLAKMERHEEGRGRHGQEQSRRGGKEVCVGVYPWETSRRGFLHSHKPCSLSICYCYLLEAILGSWNVLVNNTDKVEREYSHLLCAFCSKGERPTINNKCCIMNSVIY